MQNATETTKLSVDELLNQQERATLIATIEPIADQPAFVQVTPFIPRAGCLCQLAMRISKDAISHVTSTGQTHFCCGKSLLVVEVSFRESASLSVTSVFNHLRQVAFSIFSNCPYEGATRCHNGHLDVCKESGPTGNLEWKETSTPC